MSKGLTFEQAQEVENAVAAAREPDANAGWLEPCYRAILDLGRVQAFTQHLVEIIGHKGHSTSDLVFGIVRASPAQFADAVDRTITPQERQEAIRAYSREMRGEAGQ